MTSILEPRHLIERGFLPYCCTCTVNPDGQSLMIRVTEPASGRVELLVMAVPTNNLTSNRVIAKLLKELRSEMVHRETSFA